MSRISFWVHLTIVCALLSVVGLAGLTYHNMTLVKQIETRLTHSAAVRTTALELLSLLKDAESGQRGFLITGLPVYLEPYHNGTSAVQAQLARLRHLLRDHVTQQDRLRRLEELINVMIEEATNSVSVRREIEGDEGFRQAREMVMTDRGLVAMKQIRQTFEELTAEEERAMADFRAESNRRTSASKAMIVCGNFLAISLLVVAIAMARSDRQKRDHAENLMKASNAELEGIVDSALDGVVAFDPDLRIRRVNPAAAEIYQCDRQSFAGKSMLQLVPQRKQDAVIADIREFCQSDEKSRRFANESAVRGDGTEFPIEATLTKSQADGQTFLTMMFRDLTDQKTGRAAIQQRNAILQQIRDAIHVCDMHDRVTYWNPGAETQYGITADEALGKDVVPLIYASCEDQWRGASETLLHEGNYSAELHQVGSGGQELIVEHRRSLIRSEDGAPVGQLVINIDITQRKKEEARERRSQRLESIGTLAGGIAHDLNNVLTPVLMSGKLLKRGEANREKLADAIVTSAERGGLMIKNLLSFAGGEHGVHDHVDLKEIAEESRVILEHTLPKEIELEMSVAADLFSIRGDATELSQVIMNLAINARDAMPQGGKLEIRMENFLLDAKRAATNRSLQPGSYVVITVVDSGCGIPPEIMERIFDPFFTTKPQDKGTGLGLATSLGIVRSHGGDITVYSESGRGTCFSIYLPAHITEPKLRRRHETQQLPEGKGETILLVDDETLILETAQAALQSHGYHVLTAHGGTEAIARYQENPAQIDLAIVDVMMPGLNGMETMNALRKINPHLKIIASSGLRRPRAAGGQADDFSAFLGKPYSDEQLLRTIGRVLEMKANV